MDDIHIPLLEGGEVGEPIGEKNLKELIIWPITVCVCLLIVIVVSVIGVSEKPFPTEQALLCYGPFIHMIFALSIWAMNIFVLSKVGVDLTNILGFPNDYPKPEDILKCILRITAFGAMHFTVFFGLHLWMKEDTWASLLPVASYVVVVILLVCIAAKSVNDTDNGHMRFIKYLGERLYGNILNLCFIERTPKVSDMFWADVLSSTIKVAVDVGSLICHSACEMMPLASVCGGVYATIGDCMRFLVLLFPFLIRMSQCCQLWKEWVHSLNGFKYLTAIAVIVLSALKYFFSHDWIFFMWIFFGAVNSVYSIFWDVVVDWNLRNFGVIFNVDSPNFWYQLSAYIWAAVSNAFLRCSLLWSYELLKSEKKRVLIMFMLTALEICRRFQFTIFRVIALQPQQPSPDNGALLPQQPPQDPQDPPNEIEVDTA